MRRVSPIDPIWWPEYLQYEKASSIPLHEAMRLCNYWWAYFCIQEAKPVDKTHKQIVFDFGCGSGYGTHILASNPNVVATGIDCNENALNAARAANPELQFTRLNLNNGWNTTLGKSDVITAFHVLEEMEHRDLFFLDASRALVDDGMLLLGLQKMGQNTNRYPENPYCHIEYGREDIIQIASRYFEEVLVGDHLPGSNFVRDAKQKYRWGEKVLCCRSPKQFKD